MEEIFDIQSPEAAQPCTIVIFGASGDLARRKLIPALYNLVECGEGLMPAQTAVLGFARRAMSREEFRASAREWTERFSRLKLREHCWERFSTGLDYLGGLDEADGFARLRDKLEEIERQRGIPPNRIYYLSIPPAAIRDCVARLSAAGLIARPAAANFTRVVVEKPIGYDLASALEINRTLREHLDESQVFRIDHYLGKETVQNLLMLRFSNNIFERLWGSRNVDHVQITVSETEGVGTRATYYDGAGALRDMVQNHILQILALLAMEPPISLEADAIREAKLNVLRALRPIRRNDIGRRTVRAQYAAGMHDGQAACGYRSEKDISPDSRTETFVAMEVGIDSWRWSGVPFYIRTGKRMPRRASSIFVQFKDVPQILFNRESRIPPNVLSIRIQPDEGFSFDVMAKRPGLGVSLGRVRMNLSYADTFGLANSPDAYERLLLDVMDGDHTLFPSDIFVEKSWEFVQSILDVWQDGQSAPIVEYPAGSWGPREADDLIGASGRTWYEP